MGCYIDSTIVSSLSLPTIKLSQPITVYNVDHTENIAGRIKEKVVMTLEVYGHQEQATLYVTTLGKQAIILGLPWLVEWNPDINWKAKMLKWCKDDIQRNIFSILSRTHKPTYDLVISFIKGEATDEARQQWNSSWMNKAMLFAYKADEQKWKEDAKKTLEQLIPKELHEYLSVFGER